MLGEVPEAGGVVLARGELCCSLGKLPFSNTEIPRCHIHFETYVLPEHLVSMVAGNGMVLNLSLDVDFLAP